MSESAQKSIFGKISPAEFVKCLRKDLFRIFLAAVVVAAGGAGIGKITTETSSSAQLVLSPLPLWGKGKLRTVEGKTSTDDLEAMLAAPLDVKSASLLCMSDEVLQKTLDQVNQSGTLEKPIKKLKTLMKMLEFSVTVAKETPYDISYAPLVVLTASCESPSEAKFIVNTWSRVVVEAAKKFQDAVQGPVAQALVQRKDDLRQELTKAELDSEKFWTDNNVLYLETRLNDIASQINQFKRMRHQDEAEAAFDKTTAETLEAQNASIPEKIALDWKVPGPLAALVGSKGDAGASKGGASSDGAGALTAEVANKAHWDIATSLAAAKANAAAKEKRIQELDRLVQDLEKERLEVQAEFAKATTGKMRVGRELIRLEDEFHDIAMKQEFAHVASSLDHPVLQVISEGAEWPVSRLGRAIQFGIMSGILGLAGAACLSILWRIFLKPALEG